MLPSFNAEVVVVDKDYAESLIPDVTALSRKLKRKQKAVEQIARVMGNGDWLLNGEPIIIDDKGEVVAGRKRLLAAIQHGVCFPALIIRNIPSDAARTVGQQKFRTVTATFQAAGHGAAAVSTAAAAAAVFNVARFGTPHRKTLESVGGMQLIEDYPTLLADASHGMAHKNVKRFLGPGMMLGMVHLTRLVDRDQSDAFFSALDRVLGKVNDNLTRKGRKTRVPAWSEPGGDPVLGLARELEAIELGQIKPDGTKKQIKSSERYRQSGVFIQAWNAFRRGDEIREFVHGDARFLIEGIDPASYEKYDSTLDRAIPQEDVRAHYEDMVSGSALEVTIEELTVELADSFLATNDTAKGNGFSGNRKPSPSTAEAYAEDILADAFVLNGETIKILRSGGLGDGQHRCLAVKKANKSIWTVIVRNVDDDAFRTMDQARKRRFGEMLAEETGHPAASTAAEALVYLWRYRNKGILSTQTPSNSALDDLFDECPGLLELAAEHAKDKNLRKKVKSMTPAISTALHYIFRSHDEKKASEYFRRMREGTYPDKNHVLDGRDLLMRNAPAARDTIRIACQAWVAYAADVPADGRHDPFIAGIPAPFDRPAGSVRFNLADAIKMRGEKVRAGFYPVNHSEKVKPKRPPESGQLSFL